MSINALINAPTEPTCETPGPTGGSLINALINSRERASGPGDGRYTGGSP
jgi:hypothetical protein